MPQTLAIDGGSPVRTAPFPRWPDPGDEEVAAVERVLRSGRLNYWTGDEARTFEREYAALLGRPFAIAVTNGTAALELALRSLGIGPGDEVVVPSRTFIATASSVVAVGATPVVADIDTDSSNLTADSVRAALTTRTRAVIPVHFGGWPVDMAPLIELSREQGLLVIEDCAQAHGGAYRGAPVGAFGHAACFSFCQDKILPTGEGGLVVFDDEEAFVRAWDYKDHGKSFRKVSDPGFHGGTTEYKWLIDHFGTNLRMDEMSAAVGRVGLRKLPEWTAARQRNALRLAAGLADVRGIRVPLPPEDVHHAFYRLYAYVMPEMLAPGWDRDRVTLAVTREGTPCQYGGCAEIYREQAFTDAGLGPARRLPGAARVHDTSVSFYVHPTLSEADVDDTVEAVRKVMGAATS